MELKYIIICLVMSGVAMGLLNLIPARVMMSEWKVVMNTAAILLTLAWLNKVL